MWWWAACLAPCPPGAWADASEEQRLRARLAEVDPEVAAVAAPVCFADDAEEGVGGGVVVLRRQGTDDARAAHLGHLLLHVRAPVPLPDGPGCLGGLEAAVAAERAALAREDDWRRGWSLPPLGPEAVEERRRVYAGRCAR